MYNDLRNLVSLVRKKHVTVSNFIFVAVAWLSILKSIEYPNTFRTAGHNGITSAIAAILEDELLSRNLGDCTSSSDMTITPLVDIDGEVLELVEAEDILRCILPHGPKRLKPKQRKTQPNKSEPYCQIYKITSTC